MSNVGWIPKIALEVFELSADDAVIFCTELETGYEFTAYVSADQLVRFEFGDINTLEQDHVKHNLVVYVAHIADLVLDAYKERSAA